MKREQAPEQAIPYTGQLSREVSGCIGKEQLAATVARSVATRMRRRGGVFARMMAYRCDYCGHWHVGPDSTLSTRKRHRMGRK